MADVDRSDADADADAMKLWIPAGVVLFVISNLLALQPLSSHEFAVLLESGHSEVDFTGMKISCGFGLILYVLAVIATVLGTFKGGVASTIVGILLLIFAIPDFFIMLFAASFALGF